MASAVREEPYRYIVGSSTLTKQHATKSMFRPQESIPPDEQLQAIV